MAIKNMDVQTNVDLFELPKVIITENGLWGEPTKASVTEKIVCKKNDYHMSSNLLTSHEGQRLLEQYIENIPKRPIIVEQRVDQIITLTPQEILYQDLQSGKIDLLTYLDKISEE
jgi:hypothetical protein